MPSRPFPDMPVVPRRDRSLGWPYLESKQARALASLLAGSDGKTLAAAPGISLPAPLTPFPRCGRRPLTPARIAKSVLAVLVAAQAMYMAATLLLILAYRFVDPPATVLMAYRKWGYGWRIEPPSRIPSKRIPPFVRSMLLSVEDGKFFEHHGLDFEAFARASEINARIGKPLYGGSTLTMQVARTLFLVPEKSYLRKYLEIVAALELELVLSKGRILELYFDYAEWGKGLFGLEAASRRWFGKGAAALTREEAARLVALLSSPIKYGPWTIERSAIVRERYHYLARRYGVEPESGDAGGSEASDASTGAGTGAGLAPPPSPEPEPVAAEGGEQGDEPEPSPAEASRGASEPGPSSAAP
jgi:monofunctional glycosyltransferase